MKTLSSLSFVTSDNYRNNLKTLLDLVEKNKEGSIIVAPEVSLTGFDYKNLDAATEFAPNAIKALKKASTDKTIVLTMLEKREGQVYNIAKVFYNGKVVYERAKARLFHIGNEHKYMSEGSDSEFEIIEVAGVKLAILICFELRFKELWKMAEGADVIAVSSWWGVLRAEHFNLLTQTLAIMNQCYVVASDPLNEECTKMSCIVKPNGEVLRNGNSPCLELEYKTKEIALMRRYIDVGIK